MKRIYQYITVVLVFALVLMMCGCKPSAPNTDENNDNNNPDAFVDESVDNNSSEDNDIVVDDSNNTEENTEKVTISLTDDEKLIIDAMGEDVIKTDFETATAEINANPYDMVGKVYQLEGIFETADGTNYIKSADSDSVFTVDYITKEIPNGTAIRLTAIINVHEHDGHSHLVLECVAVESLN